MEQITLTKEELKEIIAKEVRKAITTKNTITPRLIFNEVRIDCRDFKKINVKYDFTKHLLEDLDYPLSLKKYERYLDHYEHNKGYVNDIHDLIRKLTLSIFGVTLNSDLSEDEYEEAATMYRNLKKYYLYLYEQRMSKLSLDDFE